MDAARLREAIEDARHGLLGGRFTGGVVLTKRDHLKELIAAAEAHLATLPKPVVFDVWGYVDPDGSSVNPVETVSTRDAAARIAARLIEEGCTQVNVDERTP